jgi:hypothetical protein
MHETVTALLETSIIAALALYDSAQLPETFFITAITLGELSYGPHATDDPLKRANPDDFHGSEGFIELVGLQRRPNEL